MHPEWVDLGEQRRVRLAVEGLASRHAPRPTSSVPPTWGDWEPREILGEAAEQMGSGGKQIAEVVAVELARGFADGVLDYQFCDDLSNDVHDWLLDVDEPETEPPSHLWRRVFEAFDEGEYRHTGDPEDLDPVDKYTRPLILAIVRDL